jgi:hypothetical protein
MAVLGRSLEAPFIGRDHDRARRQLRGQRAAKRRHGGQPVYRNMEEALNLGRVQVYTVRTSFEKG